MSLFVIYVEITVLCVVSKSLTIKIVQVQIQLQQDSSNFMCGCLFNKERQKKRTISGRWRLCQYGQGLMALFCVQTPIPDQT